MGCHTWYYNKIEIDFEQTKKVAIERLNHYIEMCDKYLEKRNYIPLGKEELLWWRKLLHRQLSWINKGWIYESCYKLSEMSIKKVGNDFFVDLDDYHDGFRRSDYPEDRLFSLEETLKYLEDNDDKIYYEVTVFDRGLEYETMISDKTERDVLKEKQLERLKRFWKEYPEGMIEFG